jgi:hypothetical protein
MMKRAELARELIRQRQEGFAFGKRLRRWRGIFIARAVFIMAGGYYYLAITSNPWVLVAVGILVGGSLQELAWLWRVSRHGGLTEEIVDWARVEAIANLHQSGDD